MLIIMQNHKMTSFNHLTSVWRMEENGVHLIDMNRTYSSGIWSVYLMVGTIKNRGFHLNQIVDIDIYGRFPCLI